MAIDAPLNIIIIGAGLAGLAAATALREHNVVVLEQSQLKEEVGAAIHLGPNASKIAIKWGLDLVKLNSPEVQFYREMGQDGNTHMKIPMTARQHFGAPWLLNHRVDLHNELRRLATTADGPGRPAIVRTGAKVAAVDCEAGTVTLTSGEKLQGDVIVGADGVHSVARTAVLGHELVAQRSGHSAYRCLIPRAAFLEKNNPNIMRILDGEESGRGFYTYMGQDRRLVAYPCRGGTLLNIVAIVPDNILRSEATEQWQAAGDMDELLDIYSDFCDDAKEILRAASSCVLWQLRDQDPLTTWVKGRVILIGDASHAMLPHQGQGGGQAVEDAEALGVFLASAPSSSVAKRLALVQTVRFDRASRIQAYSREKALGPREGEKMVNAQEYAMYNFGYNGAAEWAEKMGIQVPGSTGSGVDKA